MFTGLVQTVGQMHLLSETDLEIECDRHSPILDNLDIGDSVAVDGVCLTVTRVLASGFVADISPETLHRTTLGQYTAQAEVNLEASLRVGSKLGGHFVTGHVDGIGTLEAVTETANAWEMSFGVEDWRVARYIVPKGSIAVNGISLTVADCNPEGTWFTVAVIPHTYAETNLSRLASGSWVNLEGDILGKYVEKFLRSGLQGEPERSPLSAHLTPGFLAEHGYL
jgi:riboflavin synthase